MVSSLVSSVSRLIKSPGFSLPVLISLAMGIGTSSAVLSLLNAVLFAPLPYRDASQLVEVVGRQSYRQYARWKDALGPSVEFLPYRVARNDVMVGNERFRNLHGCVLPLEALSVLGVAPLRGGYSGGRAGETIVLSYRAWVKLFGGNSGAIGGPVALSGRQYTVMAIMPKDFDFPPAAAVSSDFWLDVGRDFASNETFQDLKLVMRVKDAATSASLQPALEALLIRDGEAGPPERVQLRQLSRNPGDNLKFGLGVAQVAAFVLLLLSCVSVGGLYLVRAERDRQGISIRVALGASRGRMARDLAIECTVMIAAVFISSLPVALALVRNLDYFLPPSFSGITGVIDWRIAGASFGLAVVCIGCFGFFPTYRRSAVDSAELLRQDLDRGAGRPIQFPISSSLGRLIVLQSAITVALLIGAGLLIQTLRHIWSVPLGFEPEHLMAFMAEYPVARYKSDGQRLALDSTVRSELQAIPGVEMAGGTNGLPFWGYTLTSVFIPQPDSPAVDVHCGFVTPGLFNTMKVRLLSGRLPDRGGQHKAIVNASMASRFWRPSESVGQTIWLQGEQRKVPYEVVAVVGDIHQRGFMTAPQPTVYFDDPLPGMTYVVRTHQDSLSFEKAALDALRKIDPGIVASAFTSMDQVLAKSVATQRWAATLLGLLSAISYLAGSIGTYAFVAHVIRRRNREIAIRLAVGARLKDIVSFIMYRTLWPVAIGAVVGMIGAAIGTRYMRSLLFGLAGDEAIVHLACTLTVLLTAVAAAGVAFVRASVGDPLQALRQS